MTKEETKVSEFQLVQVPTEHTLMVQTPDEKIISLNELIVKIANDLEEIKKTLLN